MPIAVTGADGQLGSELCRQLGPAAVGYDRRDLDLTSPRMLRRVLLDLRPRAIINAAAYTQVDRAEQEPDRCWAINAHAVETLATICRQLDIPLVQVSTNYVFGGEANRAEPYTEDDPPAPLSIYGKSKLAGEQCAAQCPRHFIVRTSALFGLAAHGLGRNFVETMLRSAATPSSSGGDESSVLKVVDDQRTVPTYAPHLARGICFLLSTRAYGTYHVVNAGSVTWYEFALEIFRAAEMPVSVRRLSTALHPTPAARPIYSVLSAARYLSLGGPVLPPWQDALQEYLRSRRAM